MKIKKQVLFLSLLAFIPLRRLDAATFVQDGVENADPTTGCYRIEGSSQETDSGFRYFYPANQDSDGDGLYDREEDWDGDCRYDEIDETDPTKKDTDGDGINDFWEMWKSRDSYNAAYTQAVDMMNAGDEVPAGLLRGDRCATTEDDPFDYASNPFKLDDVKPWDCDGDGRVNGRDDDSDNDGIKDLEENCIKDGDEYLLAPANQFKDECKGTARFRWNFHLWQELSPYRWDTDNDGIADWESGAADEPSDTSNIDLCPRTDGGSRNGSNFDCVRDLCRVTILQDLINSHQGASVDTDNDRRPDLKEDDNGNCIIDGYLESDPYNPRSDTDAMIDSQDPCPLDPNPRCLGVCIPGNGAKSAITGASIDRKVSDYDGDGISDWAEDVDQDCTYTDPSTTDGELVGLETNWRNADTDGDVDQFPEGGLGVGNDRLDRCPHLNPDPADITDEFYLNRYDESFTYPKCLVYYCNAAMGRLAFSITSASQADTDGDGILDRVENPSGTCEAAINELETDPLDPDTDGDGVDDGNDPCPHLANVTECPEICPEGQPTSPFWSWDTDKDGLKNNEEDTNLDCEPGPFESNPFKADTDGDGRPDKTDACPWDPSDDCLLLCDPDTTYTNCDRDSDGDGLKDCEEDSDKDCNFFGQTGGASVEDTFDTNIMLRDSDGDGISDRVDGCQQAVGGLVSPDLIVVATEDEMNCARIQCLEAVGRYPGKLKDSDRDGIPDWVEDGDNNCEVTSGADGQSLETDRFNDDTDRDGVTDGREDKNLNGRVDPGETDPRNPDSDADGIPDGTEDINHNGRVDFGECDPTKVDTDLDQIPDGIEDFNHNGLWDGGQPSPNGPCKQEGNNGSPETSCYLPDSDRDNQPDGIEDINKNGIFTTIGSMTFDGDFEHANGETGETFPCNPDTDTDTLMDGQEDLNHNGQLELLLGETSPLSPNTNGRDDRSTYLLKNGFGGCSLLPE